MRYVVIGGGLAGLMAARSLRVTNPAAEVTVIERNAELGGLLGGKIYPNDDLYFDQGTHIFQETGEAELDEFLLAAVPASDLLHFQAGEGDRSGTVFNGRLQFNSHFLDIRERHDASDLIASLETHVAAGGDVPGIDRIGPLLATSRDRFGDYFAERVLGPTLARAYGQPAEALAGFAMLLPGFTRVVAHGFEDWLRNASCSRYRAVFGVPDQRDLPEQFRHTRRSFYARRRGSRAFIDGVAAALINDGVSIECDARVIDLDLSRRSLKLVRANGKEEVILSDGIVIATGIVGAAQLLGIDIAPFGFERPMPHWVINLLVSEPVDTDLCYVYGFDERADFYRVTNYRAFSGDTADRRISVEVLGRHHVETNEFPQHIANQLRHYGLLRNASLEFIAVGKLGAGFPTPTVKTMSALSRLGSYVTQRIPEGVLLGGIGAGTNLFFQNEVVADLYRRTKSLV